MLRVRSFSGGMGSVGSVDCLPACLPVYLSSSTTYFDLSSFAALTSRSRFAVIESRHQGRATCLQTTGRGARARRERYRVRIRRVIAPESERQGLASK